MLIKLTRHDGKLILVNTNAITTVEPHPGFKQYTNIGTLFNTYLITVLESIEEIADKSIRIHEQN